MGKLDGKVAVVTGAGSPLGLGRAYALAMAAEGARVVVNDVNASAEAVAQEIVDAGGEAVASIARVGTKAAAENIVGTAISSFGRIDVLVNNAGIVSFAKILDLDEEQWDRVFDVHVKGAVFCSQAAARWMVDNGVKGRLIYITSTAGIYGTPEGGSDYSAAKAALVGLTKSHSLELAAHGICVNAVAPGAMTMEMEKMPPEFTAMAEKMIASSVLQRVGLPEDVSPLIVFLASDDARYITGQVIAATGNTGVV